MFDGCVGNSSYIKLMVVWFLIFSRLRKVIARGWRFCVTLMAVWLSVARLAGSRLAVLFDSCLTG